MALTELETRRVEKAVGAFVEKHRPAPSLRHQVDLGFRIVGQSVEIFEIRPAWRRPDETLESPVAKATYVRAKDVWRVFWKRADSKWHAYPPAPHVGTIDKFLELVDKDPHACFWG